MERGRVLSRGCRKTGDRTLRSWRTLSARSASLSIGDPDRDPRERVITVAYYALVPTDEVDIQAGTDAEGVSWFGMEELPGLAFDHEAILGMACERLRAKLDYSTIAFQFMPRDFTLSELQHVYELILREPVDKRNFRKRILGLDLIEETGELKRHGAGINFFYMPQTTSLAVIPISSQDCPFIFNETTADYQEVSIQGTLTYRVTEPTSS